MALSGSDKRKEKDMIKVARLMVLVFAISGTAFAELPYKEVEAVLPEITCNNSPHGKHEHVGNEAECEFCGSSSYGSGCNYSPTEHHRHGHGDNKCIWCGSTSTGSGCNYSPSQRHEK